MEVETLVELNCELANSTGSEGQGRAVSSVGMYPAYGNDLLRDCDALPTYVLYPALPCHRQQCVYTSIFQVRL